MKGNGLAHSRPQRWNWDQNSYYQYYNTLKVDPLNQSDISWNQTGPCKHHLNDPIENHSSFKFKPREPGQNPKYSYCSECYSRFSIENLPINYPQQLHLQLLIYDRQSISAIIDLRFFFLLFVPEACGLFLRTSHLRHQLWWADVVHFPDLPTK